MTENGFTVSISLRPDLRDSVKSCICPGGTSRLRFLVYDVGQKTEKGYTTDRIRVTCAYCGREGPVRSNFYLAVEAWNKEREGDSHCEN